MPGPATAKAPSGADLLTHAAREGLGSYIATVHKTDTGRPAIPPEHLARQVIPAVEDDSLGHTLIIAPPSSAKTVTMIAACCWWLGQEPTQHIAFIANTDRRAYERSVAIRDTIELNTQYQAIFPDAMPDKPKGWAEYGWFLDRPDVADKDPTLLAAGVGSSILGARLHRGVLDDIADEDNMATELQREKVRRWLSKTFMTRIMPGGRVVMICTRWHEEDPAAWAIDQGWHVVVIKGLDEDGESYWPEQWPSHVLACPNDVHAEAGTCCKKRELGSMAFGQQYQAEAVSEEAAMFKRGWWGRYDALPEAADRGCITVDTAGWDSKSTTSDYTAVAAWKTDERRYYLVDLARGRWEFPDAERVVKDFKATYNLPVVVEDTPWARPRIERLKQQMTGVIAWPTLGRSKVNRARAVLPYVEAGDCLLPKDKPWVDDFIHEHAQFPNGAHDDQVDTTSMALLYLSRGVGGGPKADVQPYRPGWDRVRA